ncbi:Chromosome partition protein Smc [Marinomonas spartinae]|uniref:hypothetical protein n=1 Tax=Marinomonas spartinae TaxID=1792290 RepID=UPI000808B839|nr:hypothetical protein [Marinomonas spartinae]SBS37784.1 Chromosome partition protein Smc [Marinomonas spartinae]
MPRKDDIEIPSLTLDQDEVSDRRPQQRPQQEPKRRLNPPPTRPTTSQSVVYKKPSLAGIYLLLFLILAAAAGAGYWLWQQNLQLRNELSGAKNKIENLDNQLLAADVSANKKGQSLEDRIKDNESEVRKLWAVAYDRNRKNISDNGDAIDALNKKFALLKDNVSSQGQRVAMQGNSFNDLENNYKKLIKSVSDVTDKVKPLSSDMSDLKSNLTKMSDKLAKLEKNIAAQSDNNDAQALDIDQVSQDLSSLQKKVAKLGGGSDLTTMKQELSKHQDAINSNDAFRAQVNSEILRIRKQINQIMLQQQLSSGSN